MLGSLVAVAEKPGKSPSPPANRPAGEGGKTTVQDLFDGKTLAGWKSSDFGGDGKLYVKDGAIVMERGSMTGITWTGKPPRSNFELTLDGMRLEGSDFFCTTTFPVGQEYCTLVVGGWGGTVVGLSNVDHYDASENSTSTSREFKDNVWYHVRIRVTDAKIRAWIGSAEVVNQEREGHTFGIRIECDASRPLGISTWNTKGAVKNIRLRELTAKEAKEPKEE
jgi:hypothetical protein